MTAETVFEVYKALNRDEKKKLQELVKDDLAKGSIFDLDPEIFRTLVIGLPTIIQMHLDGVMNREK